MASLNKYLPLAVNVLDLDLDDRNEKDEIVQSNEIGDAILGADGPYTEDVNKSSPNDSDVEDVLNCLKNPWEVKCASPQFRARKEDNVLSKAAFLTQSDSLQNYYPDYGILLGSPLQISVVHVKGCNHDVLAGINASKTLKLAARQRATVTKRIPQTEDEEQILYGDDIFLGRDNDVVKYAPPHLLGQEPPYSELQDILNCVVHPKAVTINGTKCIQEVSTEPTRRAELIKLAESIELQMIEDQCKNCRFDPVRRRLFEQLFDELIRQETIISAETGLFLCRIRNELLMTLSAWEKLTTNASIYSTKRATEFLEIVTPLIDRVNVEEDNILELQVKKAAIFNDKALINFDDVKTEERHAELRKIEMEEIIASNKCVKVPFPTNITVAYIRITVNPGIHVWKLSSCWFQNEIDLRCCTMKSDGSN